MLHVMPSSRIFRTVEATSHAIYLHHALFAAAARMVLHWMHAGDGMIFCVSLIAGLCGPMVLVLQRRKQPQDPVWRTHEQRCRYRGIS